LVHPQGALKVAYRDMQPSMQQKQMSQRPSKMVQLFFAEALIEIGFFL
jgi:hypothetical protein